MTISATITRGVAAATASSLTFDITAGASSEFPVELQVYTDNGAIPGELDALDTYHSSSTQNNVSDGPITLSFSPRDANIIIVGKTAAGCFGIVKHVTTGLNQVLPVKLLSFTGTVSGENAVLAWKVDNNETIEKFELESSANGLNFSTVKLIGITASAGIETYNTSQPLQNNKVYYRLKMFDNKGYNYSKIIAVEKGAGNIGNVRLLQNPVSDKMKIAYLSGKEAELTMRIVDLSGRERIRKSLRVFPGSNQLSYDVDNSMPDGVYIALFESSDHRAAVRVVKSR